MDYERKISSEKVSSKTANLIEIRNWFIHAEKREKPKLCFDRKVGDGWMYARENMIKYVPDKQLLRIESRNDDEMTIVKLEKKSMDRHFLSKHDAFIERLTNEYP